MHYEPCCLDAWLVWTEYEGLHLSKRTDPSTLGGHGFVLVQTYIARPAYEKACHRECNRTVINEQSAFDKGIYGDHVRRITDCLYYCATSRPSGFLDYRDIFHFFTPFRARRNNIIQYPSRFQCHLSQERRKQAFTVCSDQFLSVIGCQHSSDAAEDNLIVLCLPL